MKVQAGVRDLPSGQGLPLIKGTFLTRDSCATMWYLLNPTWQNYDATDQPLYFPARFLKHFFDCLHTTNLLSLHLFPRSERTQGAFWYPREEYTSRLRATISSKCLSSEMVSAQFLFIEGSGTPCRVRKCRGARLLTEAFASLC